MGYLSTEDREKLAADYGTSPGQGYSSAWTARRRPVMLLPLGTGFDSMPWTGRSCGEKPAQTIEMEIPEKPEKYVTMREEFDADRRMLPALENPTKNLYEVARMRRKNRTVFLIPDVLKTTKMKY